jgi:hypothetical protein
MKNQDPPTDERNLFISPAEVDKLRLVWIAMTTASVVYAILAWFVGPLDVMDSGFVRIVTMVAAGITGVLILVTFLMKPMLAAATGGNYTSFAIVRWALIEAIGPLGLILKILGAETLTAFAFIILSGALIATMPPSLNEGEELRQSLR